MFLTRVISFSTVACAATAQPIVDVDVIDGQVQMVARDDGTVLLDARGVTLHDGGPLEVVTPSIDVVPFDDGFDVTGRWRIRENGAPIDTRGELYDGTPVDSPGALVDALLRRPEPLLRTFTQNLMAYALGRRVEHTDQPAIRAIVRRAAEDDHRISAFVRGVVASDAFRMRNEVVSTPDGSGVLDEYGGDPDAERSPR